MSVYTVEFLDMCFVYQCKLAALHIFLAGLGCLCEFDACYLKYHNKTVACKLLVYVAIWLGN